MSLENPRPRAQRTLTLIAKSLQGLANLSTFGAKEAWMEPMNKFLQASRPDFKTFVDRICSVPSERPSQAVSASYATPIQILARLPPTSREGFPSLPFLIDSAKSFASLISLWLQKRPNNVDAKFDKDHALRRFHQLCVEIQQQTKDCLNSAEPAERPTEGLELQWEQLLLERERSATFHEESNSRPGTRAGDEDAGVSRTDIATKRQSNGFFMQPATPLSIPQVSERRETDLPRSAASFIGDHVWSGYTRTEAKENNVGSAASSKNSSSLSLEVGESSRVRSNTISRDGSSKNRFKDLVSGSARRRMREGAPAPRPEARNEF